MFKKIIQSAKLITLPEIYIQLKTLMDEPDYSMAEVAVLVGSDPGLATSFLKLVNSPLNRRSHEIETVSHAVSLLGIQQIHDTVLSACVAKAFKGIDNQKMDMKKFWHQSFYCGVMAKQLALECGVPNSDRTFTTGLLHDIGHMVMYQAIPEKAQKAAQRSENLEQPLYLVERQMLGFDFAKLGRYLMEQWYLPKNFQTVIRFYPEPDKAPELVIETALLHLAYLLVLSELGNGDFGEGAYTVSPSVWKTTSLNFEQCLEYREKAFELFQQSKSNLLI